MFYTLLVQVAQASLHSEFWKSNFNILGKYILILLMHNLLVASVKQPLLQADIHVEVPYLNILVAQTEHSFEDGPEHTVHKGSQVLH